MFRKRTDGFCLVDCRDLDLFEFFPCTFDKMHSYRTVLYFRVITTKHSSSRDRFKPLPAGRAVVRVKMFCRK